MSMTYRGRFAPSPTGPLHFGSLVAAVGSYLEAKVRGGEWLLRIEDLDTARCQPEWSDDILRTLDAFGFEWQGTPLCQSQRKDIYLAALDRLAQQGHTYPCSCSRREIADSAMAGDEGPIYPGTCRNGSPNDRAARTARALRVRVVALPPLTPIEFCDAIQGEVRQDLARDIGDFVVRRADGVCAYQLAVVVDDADQGITDVVRGADLLLSTPRQIHLQRLLGLPEPRYAHLPVAVNADGHKLSKQTAAPPVARERAAEWLAAALSFLRHPPPDGLPLTELWQWAEAHWSLDRVPQRAGTAPAFAL